MISGRHIEMSAILEEIAQYAQGLTLHNQGTVSIAMSVEGNLRQMERSREAYWLRYPNTSPIKLRWRAVTVRHSFHVLPGESIVELGAGSGLWTEHLTNVLRGENSITAAVFNHDLLLSGTK